MDEQKNIIPEENENQQTELPETEDFEFLGDPTKNAAPEKKKLFASSKLGKFMPLMILGVIAVLLLSVGITLAVLNKEPEDDKTEQSDAIKLFDFTGTTAERLEIDNQIDKYAFVRKLEKTYYIEGHEDCAVTNSSILSLLTYFGSLEAVTEVSKDVTDFEQFGLTKPVSKVTWIKGETKHILEIGDIAASGNYYVRVDEGNTVYTLAADVAVLFCSPRMDFYNSYIYDFNQDTDANYINYFELTRRGEKTIKIELSDLSKEDIDAAYKIVEPIKHNVGIEKSNAFTDIVANMNSLTVYDDDVSKDGLKKYGLDDPYIKFTFVNVATEYKFRISETTEKGYAYVYLEGGSFVYIVDSSTIEILTYKLADYCESMTYTRTYDTIDSLVITGGGKRYEIKITGDSEDGDLKAYINNKFVEYENFSDLYVHIIGIEVKDIQDNIKLGQTVATITVKCKDGTVDTLKYYKMSDLYSCFVLNNNPANLVVSTAKAEQIIEFAQRLYDGKEIVTEF